MENKIEKPIEGVYIQQIVKGKGLQKYVPEAYKEEVSKRVD